MRLLLVEYLLPAEVTDKKPGAKEAKQLFKNHIADHFAFMCFSLETLRVKKTIYKFAYASSLSFQLRFSHAMNEGVYFAYMERLLRAISRPNQNGHIIEKISAIHDDAVANKVRWNKTLLIILFVLALAAFIVASFATSGGIVPVLVVAAVGGGGFGGMATFGLSVVTALSASVPGTAAGSATLAVITSLGLGFLGIKTADVILSSKEDLQKRILSASGEADAKLTQLLDVSELQEADPLKVGNIANAALQFTAGSAEESRLDLSLPGSLSEAELDKREFEQDGEPGQTGEDSRNLAPEEEGEEDVSEGEVRETKDEVKKSSSGSVIVVLLVIFVLLAAGGYYAYTAGLFDSATK